MRVIRRSCLPLVVVFAVGSIVHAQEADLTRLFNLELTGIWSTQASMGSPESGPDPSASLHRQYSRGTDMDGFTFSDLRAGFSLGRFQIVTRFEQSPELKRSYQSTVNIPADGKVIPYTFENQQTTTMRSYDVGIAMPLEINSDVVLSPSLSASYFDGRSSSDAICAVVGGPPSTCTSRDHEGLLGLAVGLRMGWELGHSMAIVGDVVARWAEGDTVYTTSFDTSSPVGGAVVPLTEERHQARSIFGGEAGVLWQASQTVGLTTGWRYRDWDYDTGSGNMHGPFMRLSIRM